MTGHRQPLKFVLMSITPLYMSTHPEQREQRKTEELEAIKRQLAYAERAAALLGQIRESIRACCGAVQTQLDTARKIYDEAEGRIKRVHDLEALALALCANEGETLTP